MPGTAEYALPLASVANTIDAVPPAPQTQPPEQPKRPKVSHPDVKVSKQTDVRGSVYYGQPQPVDVDVSVIGKTVTAMSNRLAMAPGVAAAITRQLYAPALNHPQMQQTIQRVQQSVGQLANAGVGPFVQLTAETFATTPPPPPPKPSPQDEHTVNAIRVLLGKPVQPVAPKWDDMSDDEAAELAGGQEDQLKDSDDSVTGVVKQGAAGVADSAKGMF